MIHRLNILHQNRQQNTLDSKWIVKWNKYALDDLKIIDKEKANLIRKKVETFLIQSPLELGEKLTFNLKGLYRYRIGLYRVIYSINNYEMLILVLYVGKRDEIYT